MNIEDIAKLQRAMEEWDLVAERRDSFAADNLDPESGEPLCNWSYWDEGITDLNYQLAEAGEHLADALRKVLG